MKDYKYLFLITNHYPFGKGEEFIENEIEYLSQNFEKIFIISKNTDRKQTRKVPKNCEIFKIDFRDPKNIILYLINFFDKLYIYDFCKNFNLSRVKNLLAFQYMSKITEKKIIQIIKEKKLKQKEIIVYSYWFHFGAYAGSILKKKNLVKKAVSRAHRCDLYEEAGVQVLKKEILKNIDCVYPCSLHGKHYLINLYKKNNIKENYLGTINLEKFKIKNKSFLIVSCSNLIELKRVDMIIKTLEILEKEYSEIEWIHFGDGIEKEKIENLAKNRLKKIKYNFKGHVTNNEIYEFYKNHEVLLFLHLSSSEGLPVSMMEAQSFGIPIVATNVGGVSEIVNDKTGILLSDNPKIEEIAKAIKKIINLTNEEYKNYEKNSYKYWMKKFNATINYNNFIKEIKS